ncbi:hypothetical protein B0H14DRAFT_2808134 [Mycena olivaceomarginata]|nr:hypothetical protein B0H14DRAFT_2808134 [Mycena olivaceomarginata]
MAPTTSEYCQHVVHPVPARLMDVILKRRKEIAAKKKVDEEKAKGKRSMLQGSMKMSGVIEINPLTRPPVVIPDSFLTAIKLKLHPALFWRTPEIPTKKNQGVFEEKALLDITKLKATCGSDDRVEGVSVLTWTNAMENFIDALKILSAEPDSTCPHSYAEERQKHFHFVKNLDDFEALFPVWYPVEKSLRNKILTNNRAYSESHWSNEIGMVLNAHKAATNIQKGSYYSSAPIRIADLGLAAPAPAPPPSGPKNERPPFRDDYRRDHGRDWGRDQRDGDRYQYRDNARDPGRDQYRDYDRNARRDSSRAPARDYYRDQGHDGFRDQPRDGFRDQPRERRPVVCLVCAGPHTVREHPPAQTDFQDRHPCFTVYEGSTLRTRPTFPRSNGRCDESRHTTERLHVCSLCGGDHPAVSADSRCARFGDGHLRP